MFKKLTVMMILILITFYIIPITLGGVSKTLPLLLERVGSPPLDELESPGSRPDIVGSSHSSGLPSAIPESVPGIDLPGGVYNASQLNDSMKDELLDPAKWYVGNTSLSSRYAFSVYNDTLNVVENATEVSESILERFLGLFGGAYENGSMVEGVVDSVKRFLSDAGELLEKADGG